MRDLVAERNVVVCCGAGGVGKTTMAAALGVSAARQGRRVCVVTVDPARRLGDALGFAEGLTADPQPVAVDGVRGEGELWAMMLDPAVELERVIRSHAVRPGQAEEALNNQFTRSISTSLGGTQEYMATEVLYRLVHDERFDLVIVDTPPSDRALAVVQAPDVLVRFLDHQVFRLLMGGGGRAARLFATATQPLLKAIGRVIGSNVLDDVVSFLRSFTGMESSFRARAVDVQKMWRAGSTAFVLVAAPTTASTTEAERFADELRANGIGVDRFILNRCTPDLSALETGDKPIGEPLAHWLEWTTTLRHAELQLIDQVGTFGVEVVAVERLQFDVHDLKGLMLLADALDRASTV